MKRCGLPLDPIFHAIAFAFDKDSFGVMEQAIEERGGERAVVVEDFGPVLICPICSEDDGTTLIALADDLEEQIGAVFVDRQIAEFVDLKQAWLEIFA